MNALDYVKIRYFKIFFEIAKEGSYAKAAAKLNLSPTLMTKDIIKFEKELGIRLFERTTRQVSLTPAGEYLYLNSQKIISELERCFDQAYKLQTGSDSTVKIGAMNTADLDLFLFPFINSFQKENPGIRLIIISDYMTELLGGLENNEYDLAVVPDFLINTAVKRDFCWQYWALNYSNVITSVNNPISAMDTVTLDELKNQTFSILGGSLNDEYEKYIREIFRPYNDNIQTGRKYKNAYTLRDTFYQEGHSVIFTDAYFVYNKKEGYKRLVVSDHKSGAIAAWKVGNKAAEKFLLWFNRKHGLTKDAV